MTRDRARPFHRSLDRIWRRGENHAALEGDKFIGEFVNPIERAAVKPRVQYDVPAVHISGLAQSLAECLAVLVLESLDAADPRKFLRWLLRARRQRPSRRRAAEQRYERAAFYI